MESAKPFGANTAGDKRHRPLRQEALFRHTSLDRQEPTIKSRVWPIALSEDMRGFAIGKYRYSLCS